MALLDAVTLSSNSNVATFSTSSLAATSHNIYAVYGADRNYSHATSNTLAPTVVAVDGSPVPTVVGIVVNNDMPSLTEDGLYNDQDTMVLSLTVTFSTQVHAMPLAGAFSLERVETTATHTADDAFRQRDKV